MHGLPFNGRCPDPENCPYDQEKEMKELEKRIIDLESRVASLEDWKAQQSEKPKLVSKLGLSRRALNVLQRAGCDTVDDVMTYGVEKLRSVYNCGETTYLEIRQAVGA